MSMNISASWGVQCFCVVYISNFQATLRYQRMKLLEAVPLIYIYGPFAWLIIPVPHLCLVLNCFVSMFSLYFDYESPLLSPLKLPFLVRVSIFKEFFCVHLLEYF